MLKAGPRRIIIGAMICYRCTIQEGVVPEETRPVLAAALTRIASEIFGGSPDDIPVEFAEIPHTFGFRGGELSTTSMVRAVIDPGCKQDVRVEFMQQVQDTWCEILGCSVDELVVTAADRGRAV